MSGFDDDDLLREFLAESREHLAGIESDLLTLEARGADLDETLVNRVFRAAHSIKGGSGYFGLKKIQELAHRTETALSLVRSRQMIPNPEIVNILLQGFDRLRELVNDVANSNNADVSEQIGALTTLCAAYVPGGSRPALTGSATVAFGGAAQRGEVPAIDVERARESGRRLMHLRFELIHDVERVGKTPLTLFAELTKLGEITDARLNVEAVGTLDDLPTRDVPLDVILTVSAGVTRATLADAVGIDVTRVLEADPPSGAAAQPAPQRPPEAPVAPVAPPPSPPMPPAAAAPAPVARTASESRAAPAVAVAEPADDTLRVPVAVLDQLMNLAGELVLGRNQLREGLSHGLTAAVTDASQRISSVTSDLQEAIMQARMQPVGNLLARFHRLTRDLARALGKEVQLEIEGRDVELDKTLLEGLTDPLTHMVRNAVDHGIETPDVRVSRGKPRMGTVKIRARHEAGQVVLEIADDGKGIDPERVTASAVEKGLLPADRVPGLTERDKIALIFLPGLSTAGEVSAVSGRGVGMDVVRTNLDRLGGNVAIESSLGIGTQFRITLPLTLAIMPSLIVSVRDERYAIPQVNIMELIRVPAEEVSRRIEIVGDAEVLVLRGALVPIVRLADTLGLLRTYDDPATGQEEVDRRGSLADRRSPRFDLVPAGAPPVDNGDGGAGAANRRGPGRRTRAAGDLNVVILSTGTLPYGLVVEAMHDTQEIVVKPLGQHMRGLREYAGATIMGDGTVALILDVAGVAAQANLISVEGSARAAQLKAQESRAGSDAQSLLVFSANRKEMCALPLDLVIRVERISPDQIGTSGGRRSMQYRESLLPILALSDVAKVAPIEGDTELAVVVVRYGEREVGLLGALPVDVIESDAVVDSETLRQPGVSGSTILREKTVLIIDLHELVAAAYPDWAARRPAAPSASGQVTVLLAEDSDFFRAQVKKYLVEAGFLVLEGADGEAAWEVLDANAARISAVVTDIEMPRLTGLGLTQRLRGDPRFRALPVIGLTSLAGEEDIERGKAAGIDDYQVKLDRDRLVTSLRSMLANGRPGGAR